MFWISNTFWIGNKWIILQSDNPEMFTSQFITAGAEGNIKSVIKDSVNGEIQASTDTTQKPLSCSDYKEFWLSWSTNHISVGTGGNIEYGKMVTWQTTDLNPIHAIGLATGPDTKGQWVQGNVNGKYQNKTTFP